ncbi:riboflavin synthase [Demequina lutea]|uniref:Riboflavin synthase n=1 Tax=Demequina lutea TaxID=431489 RepID=A0A7Y9ZB82_9MICO|nr:riboflavin synthase [Demequina lutea]NYI41388.1 riboflavin synthase [Demequina lutea]
MFTGIVEAIGTVATVEDHGASSRFVLTAPQLGTDIVHGESIAVNGVCLTVAAHEQGGWAFDVMRITEETTTMGELAPGIRVNLERATRADGRLGGHIMQGHVDGVATLVARDSQPEWDDLTFTVPRELLRYVVLKGSISLNGVSLTVAGLVDDTVTVSLIPTTLTETTLGELVVGNEVNVEVDIIAKYVERMMGLSS